MGGSRSELLEQIRGGESSTVQFKEKVNHVMQLAQEICAMANTMGGQIFIGLRDDGSAAGLDPDDVTRLNQWVSNAASQHIRPPLAVTTDNMRVEDKTVMVISVPAGYAKPYYTNDGVAYIKMGADKRIAPPEEILRLYQSAGKIYADEDAIPGTGKKDLDESAVKMLLYNKFRRQMGEEKLSDVLHWPMQNILAAAGMQGSLWQLLQNMKLAEGEVLTLAGLLLLAKNPQQYRPLLHVKCLYIKGDSLAGGLFLDKPDAFTGNMAAVFKSTIDFVMRFLRHIQVSDGFNTLGQLEIPMYVLEEFIVNALVHRDYYVDAGIQLHVFDNRIEIISPGRLPNTLNEQNIRVHTSIARNPILYSNCAYAGLPFSGVGSGIPRAINAYKDVDLQNDYAGNKFTVIINRRKD